MQLVPVGRHAAREVVSLDDVNSYFLPVSFNSVEFNLFYICPFLGGFSVLLSVLLLYEIHLLNDKIWNYILYFTS